MVEKVTRGISLHRRNGKMNRLHLEWVKESKVVQVFRRAIFLCLGASFLGFYSGVAGQDVAMSVYQRDANRIIEAATGTHRAYERLGDLVDTFGHRLSGSVALEQAIDWIVQQMENDGLDNVRTDHVMVPHLGKRPRVCNHDFAQSNADADAWSRRKYRDACRRYKSRSHGCE